MIPEEELLSEPIKLRHACIFYLGHIPTFLDIHITRATGDSATEPAYFRQIFERGIDPDVENPELCHDHSEIPDAWPPLDTILEFQRAVREKVKSLYTSGAVETGRRISRALWLAFEHEAMHLETLLYMLIQSEKILPPPGTVTPDFEALARESELMAVENEWFTVPESNLHIGLEDPESEDGETRYFGWDNEKPARSSHVKAFRAKARPITNGEYAEYLATTGKTSIPASWCEAPYSTMKEWGIGKRDSVMNGHVNGSARVGQNITEGKYVRTVYGAVPLRYAWNWPVVASYDELAGCARWMGGRIPTMEEARSIYSYVEHNKAQDFAKALGNRIPAVNG